jgi:hypothetical protein
MRARASSDHRVLRSRARHPAPAPGIPRRPTQYYPLQADVAGGEEGWADLALRLLGYDTNPVRLQTAIRSLFARATSRIALDGVRVVACPLFNVLDPLKPSDYVARVEPSAQGAAKMAAAFVRIISENAAKVGAAGAGGSGTGGAARAAGAGEAL